MQFVSISAVPPALTGLLLSQGDDVVFWYFCGTSCTYGPLLSQVGDATCPQLCLALCTHGPVIVAR